MTTVGTSDKFTVHLPDEGLMLELRVVLAYESTVRGLTVGQTCSEMIMEAVDLNRYPEEVKQRLKQINEESRTHAVKKSLGMNDDEE